MLRQLAADPDPTVREEAYYALADDSRV